LVEQLIRNEQVVRSIRIVGSNLSPTNFAAFCAAARTIRRAALAIFSEGESKWSGHEGQRKLASAIQTPTNPAGNFQLRIARIARMGRVGGNCYLIPLT
jgi:hypothetical protein